MQGRRILFDDCGSNKRPKGSVNEPSSVGEGNESAVREPEDHFEGKELIGQGSFGRVYKATWNGQLVAVKDVLGTAGRRVLFEAAVMRRIGGRNNVCPLLRAVELPGSIALVLPFRKSTPFMHYFMNMDELYMSRYLGALLDAIEAVHSERVFFFE